MPIDLSPPFLAFLERELGDELPDFLAHPEASGFVRANTLRATPAEVLAVLERYGLSARPHPVMAEAIEVGAGADPTGLFHHFLGAFVQQSLGSMIPAHVLDVQPGQRVLDLCAAPGSKSTQLAADLAHQGELWANDLAGVRMTALAARLDGVGASNVVLVNRPGEQLPNNLGLCFDRVLADVPCSGLGTRANLSQAQQRWSARRSETGLTGLQYRLAVAACRQLVVGGRMVYSTCSLTTEENEAVLGQILARLPMRLLPLPPLAGVTVRPGRTNYAGRSLHPSLSLAGRVCPWENPSEGFFVAMLEKTDELPERHRKPPSPEAGEWLATQGIDDEAVRTVLGWIERDYGLPVDVLAPYRFRVLRKGVLVFPPSWTRTWAHAHRAGASLGKLRGGMLRLSHGALQRWRGEIRRNRIELDREALERLASTGSCELPGLQAETPYPAVSHGEIGVFASTYKTDSGLRWKQARTYRLPQ